MKKINSDFIKLNIGLFLYSLGMVIGYEAHVGYAPWEVFHVGISKVTNISIGQASILMGLLILLYTILKKEPLGIGSILNMIVVGLVFDLILYLGFIPTSHSFTQSMIYVFLAMVIISFATYFYVGAGFGAGPRDGLMISISRRFGFSMGASRRFIEITVTVLGYFMGGQVGIGTLIFAFVTGYIMDFIFTKVNFDPKTVEHRLIKKRQTT